MDPKIRYPLCEGFKGSQFGGSRAQSGFAGLVVVGSDVLFVDVVRSDIMAFAETWFL